MQLLRAAFQVEAAEHLQALSANLLALETTPAGVEQAGLLETIFRSAHSLKGAARAVNEGAIERICQRLEDVFAAWKKGERAPVPEEFDGLHRALDEVNGLVTAAALPGAGAGAADRSGGADGSATGREQREAPGAAVTAPVPAPAAPAAALPQRVGADTIRVRTERLDNLLWQAEELLSAKLTAAQRALELAEVAEGLATWKPAWTKARVELDAARRRPGESGGGEPGALVELLKSGEARVKELQHRLAALARQARQDHRVLAGRVDNLLADAKSLMWLPCAPLLDTAHRVARDLAREQGKEVEVILLGHEVELDKRMLEEMKDPLIHLIRNAIDHGVERPEVRSARGKPARARLQVTVVQLDSGKVEIVVEDDGGGIAVAKVRAAAVKCGALSDAAARQMDDAAAVALIFESGVSTAGIITEISGRGLGMAIVRENIARLGGRVSVATTAGAGTVMRILLPTSLATLKGILVQASTQAFVIPSPNVERVVRVRATEVRVVAGRHTVMVGGAVVPLVQLDEVLGLKAVAGERGGAVTALVLGTGENRIAFRVAAVAGEQEVLVKALSFPLTRVRHIAGATVLGSGRLVPVLRAADLLAVGLRLRLAAVAEEGADAQADASKGPATKAILLAEDSITSRMLLKNILESAGYVVTTAVDGADAWRQLERGSFVAVVSDVDMPRMNGFELTARIRADAARATLPVVLVTARGSPEDRERGVESGANAYIVKSSFDQGDLLAVLGTLI